MSMGTRGAMKTAWSVPSAAVRSFEPATLNESIDIIHRLWKKPSPFEGPCHGGIHGNRDVIRIAPKSMHQASSKFCYNLMPATISTVT